MFYSCRSVGWVKTSWLEMLMVWNTLSGTPDGASQGRIVQSAGACAELCREFGDKCQSFTWRPDRGNSCWLKNDWTFSNERTGDQQTWSGIRCTSQKKGVTPSRDPDGLTDPSLPPCESPDQVTYWKGMEAYGPVWPAGRAQFKKTSSAKVRHQIN